MAGEVVLGYDDSPSARAALDVAIEQAKRFGGRLVIVFANAPPGRRFIVGTYGESPLRSAILGSTPHQLLQISETPVLCVPASPREIGRSE
jgi:nucleotide-binding universal stress UspA family protein